MILSLQRACPKPNPAPFESSGEEGVIADNFTGTLICWSLISAVLLCDGTYGTWPQPSAEGKMIQGSSDKTQKKLLLNLFSAGSLTLQTRAGGSCPAEQGFLTINTTNVYVW